MLPDAERQVSYVLYLVGEEARVAAPSKLRKCGACIA